jgi:hypothetical protein
MSSKSLLDHGFYKVGQFNNDGKAGLVEWIWKTLCLGS